MIPRKRQAGGQLAFISARMPAKGKWMKADRTFPLRS